MQRYADGTNLRDNHWARSPIAGHCPIPKLDRVIDGVGSEGVTAMLPAGWAPLSASQQRVAIFGPATTGSGH